ncbi:MAG: Flp pilus assembly complex ATPase component TadA [Coriobacteriales bacterium]|jgi:type IV pilus assembly protein PilB|nr:Flp pilus assembly complex ATPase component TadA [Coriobacteriales bacterium]
MAETRQIRLGDLLREYGYLDDEQLDQALEYQKHRDVRLGQAVAELGFATEDEVLLALSHKLGLPKVTPSSLRVDVEAVARIPRSLAERSCAIAVAESDGVLDVVTNDPVNLYAIEEIRHATQRQLRLLIGDATGIQDAIAHYYSEVEAREAVNRAEGVYASLMPEIERIDTVALGDDSTPVVSLLNSLMTRSYSNGASDLHIEPFADVSRIRMRIDGTLIEYADVPTAIHSALIVRIKIMGNLDIAEKRLPQDGHFRVAVGEVDLNVRVSVIPTIYGEKAVMRFLTTNAPIDHAGRFGMGEEDYERFMRILRQPNGIIYLTGPTGSGKTTTMYMALEHFRAQQINISSIEDPVERSLDGVNQMQVNNQAGLTFAAGLRSLMRQDPDIIMVGETRDPETASISVSAAITGHLVLSTLHTNDALASVVRLEDMGIPPYLVGNSVVGLVAQRLMRKICTHCAEEYLPSELDLLNLREGDGGGGGGGGAEGGGGGGGAPRTLRRGAGCHVCNQTGSKGRIAIHEIVAVDRRMQRMIAEGAPVSQLHDYARKEQGMATLRERARALVLDGICGMEELLKIGGNVE